MDDPSAPSNASVTPQASPVPTETPLPIATSSPTPVESAAPASPSAAVADLEALLPAAIRGVPFVKDSLNGAEVPLGGDMCSMICPGEPHALAEALGVNVDQVDLAVAYPDEAQPDYPRVAIVAYRARGVATDALIPARIEAMRHDTWPGVFVELTIDGKDVTWAAYSPLPSVPTMEYLYAREDVLFRVIDEVRREQGSETPPDTVLAIEALP